MNNKKTDTEEMNNILAKKLPNDIKQLERN